MRAPRGDLDYQTQWAELAYQDIRTSSGIDEVARTAAAAGFSQQDIEQIYSHLFVEEHVLDRYGESAISRFDEDPSIAEAWMRLEDGSPHPSDFDLLRHELNESNWMRENGSQNYSAAHQATLDAGFTWDPYAAARDGLGYGAQYQP